MPFFKADFRITISNVKITWNNDFKIVPETITGYSYLYTGYTWSLVVK